MSWLVCAAFKKTCQALCNQLFGERDTARLRGLKGTGSGQLAHSATSIQDTLNISDLGMRFERCVLHGYLVGRLWLAIHQDLSCSNKSYVANVLGLAPWV